MQNFKIKPTWLNKKINLSQIKQTKTLLKKYNLHTVCEEALCPNISECFNQNTATFLILGDICTRKCYFCNIKKGNPTPPNHNEPKNIALAVKELQLKHVVITSPTRDDLKDGGSIQYVITIKKIRELLSHTTIEALIPDFLGNTQNIKNVVNAKPDIIGHNLETIPRVYEIRKGADYNRSLKVLKTIKEIDPKIKTKSGIMLGFGEQEREVVKVFKDLINVGCKYLSIGQYLAPSKNHFPVIEFIHPNLFKLYEDKAYNLGFKHVESAPYVRSSYHAQKYISSIVKT
ncbi:lipoyl synthase [Candidatus Margulisiibacteriota bacterium]